MHSEISRPGLRWAYETLRATGRGKHVGAFSYYHVDIVRHLDAAHSFLDGVRYDFGHGSFAYNVVKLNRASRLSFLRYETFCATFPALLASLSCDLGAGTARLTDYARRHNPPILHRKELLLWAHDPLAEAGARLTAGLEARGAFVDRQRIGTRDGWAKTLATLGLSIDDGKVVGW